MLLTHFSSRYNIEVIVSFDVIFLVSIVCFIPYHVFHHILVMMGQEIREAVLKLQSKVSAKVIPLTEGFRSKYS